MKEGKNTPTPIPALKKLSSFLEQGTLWVDQKGIILKANRSITVDLKFENSEIVGKKIVEIVPSFSILYWKKLWGEIEQQENLLLDGELMSADAIVFPVSINAIFFKSSNREEVLLIVKNKMAVDRFKDLLEMSSNITQTGAWEWDLLHGQFISSENLISLLNIKNHSIDNPKNVFSLLQSAMQKGAFKALKRNLRRAINDGIEFESEFNLKNKENNYKRFFLKTKVFEFEGTVNKIYGTVQDLSDIEERTEDLYLAEFSLQHTPDMVFWVDKNAKFVYANKACVDRLQYTQKELLNMHIYNINPNYDSKIWEGNWTEFVKSPNGIYQTEHVNRVGERYPVEIRYATENYKGEMYYIGFVRDISKVVEREELLELSKFTMDENPDMIFWLNENGKLKYFNNRLCENLKYTREEINELVVSDFDPDYPKEKFKDNWNAVKNKGKVFFESQHVTKYGEKYPIETTALFLTFKEQDYLVCHVKNISDTYEEKEFQAISSFTIENSNDIILWTNREGEVKFANKVAADELGYSIPELKAMNLLDLGGGKYNQTDFDKISKLIEKNGSHDFESIYKTKKGKLFPVEITAKKITYKNLPYVVSFIKNIKKQKRRARDLTVSKLTLDQSEEMVLWVKEDGAISFANQSSIDKFADSNEELLNMMSYDLSPDFNKEMWPDHWKNLKTEKTMKFETNCIDKHGTVFPTDVVLQYVVLDSIAYNIATIRDISEQRKKEHQLRRNQFAVDNATSLIIWVDLEGQLVFANQTAKDYIGINDVNIQKLELKNILIDFDANVWEEWLHALKEKTFGSRENLLKRKNFGPCPISLTANYIDLPGYPLAIALFINDVTDLKKQSMKLEIALDELNQLKNQITEEKIYLEEELASHHNFNDIISTSPNYRKVLKQIEQVAGTDATVLIHGETGTGKELLARAVHGFSLRADKPLVKVNCAALPENLIESELFGHEKGAFTGAYEKKIGRFELANKGTIFLDEIGEMPIELQSKLLRVLQEGEFERLGNPVSIKVDVRVVVATNRSLEKMVKEGKFRQDLYYRLNVFPVYNIPLRERKEDIPLLVQHFIKKFADKIGKEVPGVLPSELEYLEKYPFPGNIRELENIIERAVIISVNNRLNFRNVLPESNLNAIQIPGEDIFPSLEESQKLHIIKALKKSNWKISGVNSAAEILKINGKTLASRMKKLGIRKI